MTELRKNPHEAIPTAEETVKAALSPFPRLIAPKVTLEQTINGTESYLKDYVFPAGTLIEKTFSQRAPAGGASAYLNVNASVALDELRKGAGAALQNESTKWYGQQAIAALDHGDSRIAFFTMYIMSVDINGYLSPQAKRYAESIITGKGDINIVTSLANELTKANAVFQLDKLGDEIAALRKQSAGLDDVSRRWADSRITALENNRNALKDWAAKVKRADELATPSFRGAYATLLAGIDKERRIASLSSLIAGQVTLNDAYAKMITGNKAALDELKKSTEQMGLALTALQMGDVDGARKTFNQAIDMKAAALIDYAPPTSMSTVDAQVREKERWSQLGRYMDDQKNIFNDVLLGPSISDREYYKKLQGTLKGSYMVEYSIFGMPASLAYARRQERIRTDVKNGMLDDAEKVLQQMTAEMKTREFAATAMLQVGGAAAFFIPVAGPWISGAIFTGIAVDNVIKTKGQSVEAWAMLGLNALPVLGVVKAARPVLLGIGTGAIAWQGENVYELYNRAAKTSDPYVKDEYIREAILGTGMLFFPLAMGGPKFVKGAAEAVPAALSRAQEAFRNAADAMYSKALAPAKAQLEFMTGEYGLAYKPRMTGVEDLAAAQRKAGMQPVQEKPKAPAAGTGVQIAQHREELLPIIQERYPKKNVEAYLLSKGFERGAIETAEAELLLPGHEVSAESQRIFNALLEWRHLFEFGGSVSPLMDRVRNTMSVYEKNKANKERFRAAGLEGGLKSMRGPATTLESLYMMGGEIARELDSPLNCVEPTAHGAAERTSIGPAEVGQAIDGFEKQLPKVFQNERFLQMYEQAKTESAFLEWLGGMRKEGRELNLDAAAAKNLIKDPELREYLAAGGIDAQNVVAAVDVYMEASAFRQRVADAREKPGSQPPTIGKCLQVVERMQKMLETGLEDLVMRVDSKDGRIAYNMRITPRTISHLTEGHPMAPEEFQGMFTKAIGTQAPYMRAEATAAAQMSLPKCISFGEIDDMRLKVGERVGGPSEDIKTSLAFSRLNGWGPDDGYTILAGWLGEGAARSLPAGRFEVDLTVGTLYTKKENGTKYFRMTVLEK